jgi:hypothetical protein
MIDHGDFDLVLTYMVASVADCVILLPIYSHATLCLLSNQNSGIAAVASISIEKFPGSLPT